MCGLAGFWGRGLSADASANVARRMSGAIHYRGPDDAGHWADPTTGIVLAHRRLAILDLSPEGHQPMLSRSGRYVIVFNGEIYNFREIRAELEDHHHQAALPRFRGHSDTEVMLAAFEAWGVEGAVERFIGMFAFALWDRERRALYLTRDRLGIKPLYYGWANNSLLFGSELKALAAHPDFGNEIDRGALALLMRHNCIPAPYSIYKGIHKLLPGTILTIRSPDEPPPVPAPYWSARQVAEQGTRNLLQCTDREAIEQLDGLLREAIRLRMVADVPLGAFLSGGIDSSAVVALMQAQSDRPVKTFSIGFAEEGYNEAKHAAAVAAHLGTEHTELYVTPDEAMAVVPKLPYMYDEPFADSSQIPTYLVSALARQHVTVSLSGDGGDELFAGYNRHVWGKKIWKRVGWMPLGLRRAGAHAMTSVSPERWDELFRSGGSLLRRAARHRTPGDKLHKLAGVLGAESPEAMYRTLTSHWKDPASLVLGSVEPPTLLTSTAAWADLSDVTERMAFLDLVSYLPDDILTKVDRASMAVSLEARVPLLDHRVVEFAWRTPLAMKIRGGQSKWLLRQVLYRYVPRKLVERPKTGFGIPLHAWLRGPMRDWAESLLDGKRLREEGFFDAAQVRAKWVEHLSGTRNWAHALWDVLMFQAWLESQDEVQPRVGLDATDVGVGI